MGAAQASRTTRTYYHVGKLFRICYTFQQLQRTTCFHLSSPVCSPTPSEKNILKYTRKFPNTRIIQFQFLTRYNVQCLLNVSVLWPPLPLCDPSLSVSQVVCQLGDLVWDGGVIYFLDNSGPTCVTVAANVLTSVTAVSIGGCVLCWLWTFTLQI